MRSTCKYGLRSISWQSQGDRTLKVRCKHVKLTCRLRNVRCTQLLTAKRDVRATYLDLAQSYGRRALTYSVPAIATPSLRFQKNVADVASARNVRTKNTHGGLGPGLKVIVPKPDNECFKKSFCFAGAAAARVWNSLPNNLQNVQSVSNFKRMYKQLFFV